MKRRTALSVLLGLAVLIPLGHIEIRNVDHAWLVVVDGRPVDVAGWVEDAWTSALRDCREVWPLQPSDPLHASALQMLRGYSPPDSGSADILGVSAQGDWLLAEARFGLLERAAVLMHRAPEGLAIPAGGIWSGATHPHRRGPFVRRYLRSRVPAAPTQLLDCFAFHSEPVSHVPAADWHNAFPHVVSLSQE